MNTLATPGVGNLVMVLYEVDETFGLKAKTGRAAPVSLPLVTLPLVQIAPLRRRDKLLWPTQVVGIISFVFSSQRHHRRMMKIIVPQSVQPVAALFHGLQHAHVLRLVLSDDDCLTPVRRTPHTARDCYQNVLVRIVLDAL